MLLSDFLYECWRVPFYFEDIYFVALVKIVFQFGQIIFAKMICTCSFETCTSATEISRVCVQQVFLMCWKSEGDVQ